MKLEHETDGLVPEGGEFLGLHHAQIRAANDDRAAVRPIQSPQQVQQGRLAGSRLSNNRHQIARLDDQVDASENLDPALAVPIGFEQVPSHNRNRHRRRASKGRKVAAALAPKAAARAAIVKALTNTSKTSPNSSSKGTWSRK